VAHPRTNEQLECANGMILQGLKPRILNDLNKFGRRWLNELPLGDLESVDNPEPGPGVHVILPSLWGRGHLAHRPISWLPKATII
jgi:hypothetical protein